MKKQINENTNIKSENKRLKHNNKSLEDKIKGRRNNTEPNTHNNVNEEQLSCQEIENIIKKNVENKLNKFKTVITGKCNLGRNQSNKIG